MAEDTPWFDTTKEEQDYELKKKWPNLYELEMECEHAQEELHHRIIYVDGLLEERNLLRKLYGVKDD